MLKGLFSVLRPSAAGFPSSDQLVRRKYQMWRDGEKSSGTISDAFSEAGGIAFYNQGERLFIYREGGTHWTRDGNILKVTIVHGEIEIRLPS